MNEQQVAQANPPSGGQATHDFDMVDVMIALAKRKKAVIGVPFLVAIATAAITLAMPNVYRATTKLLPPQQQQSGAAGMLAQLGGGAASVAAGMGALKNPNDLYIGMLKSRTVADRIVARFNLTKVYGTPSVEKARKNLEGATVISSGKDSLIAIQVEDKDQKLVAPLANAYADELLRLTRELAVTDAAQRRLFYERQLEQSKNNLTRAETALKGSLDTRGVINVDTESSAISSTVARLRAQVSAKEIELDSKSAFITPNHPDYRRAQEDLNSLRAELARLENGRRDTGSQQESKPANPAGFENTQLLRDLKYHQMLYELLAKQYEVARLDEAKQPSIIQVLDQAVQPERKAKPQRTLIVLGAFFVSLLVTTLWALLAEVKTRALRIPERAAQWDELRANLALKSRRTGGAR